jgi:hypothetical protein
VTVTGIDVSGYQGPTPAVAGLAFCLIKATEGTTVTNSEQAAQAVNARTNGLVVGFYHFLWPGNITAQAQYFVEQCDSVPGDLLICDWETTEDGTAATGAEKDAFLAAVKSLRPDHKVLLYCNRDFWLNHDTTSDCGDGLWIADPDSPAGHPNIVHSWVIHQYGTSAASVDLDVADFADTAAMRAWAAPPTPPAPKPVVSLAHVIAAATKDPSAPQGHTTYKADVLVVEKSLCAEGLLDERWVDGSFGTLTISAYSAWQKDYSAAHDLGWTGAAVNGIPGRVSLVALGEKHGFTVT